MSHLKTLICTALVAILLLLSSAASGNSAGKENFNLGREAMAQGQHDKAIQLLEQAASQGYSDAVTLLIRYYISPEFENHKKAFELALARVQTVKNDAEKLKAYSELASLYAQGIGVPKDEAKAIEQLKKVAHLSSNVSAQIGVYYFNQAQSNPGLFKESAQWIMKAIKNQLRIYLNPNFLVADYAFNNQDYKTAATAGHLVITKGGATSQETLGFLSKRAEQGDADALLFQAFAYASGHYFTKDYKKAHTFYQQAAAKNHLNAVIEYIAFLEEAVKDHNAAAPYRVQGAQLGHSKLQKIIAKDYFFGINGLAKNTNEAFRWLNQALRNGEHGATELWMELNSKHYKADHSGWIQYGYGENSSRHHYEPSLIIGPISNLRQKDIYLAMGMVKHSKVQYYEPYPGIYPDEVEKGYDSEVVGYFVDCKSNKVMVTAATLYNRNQQMSSNINESGLTEWITIEPNSHFYHLRNKVCKN
ncbi:surface-adhesin E family protein [Kangiella sp.]|uniref:tetratricopeptide repeat protein n=1 Tax=Kangiella sp. TaxID=1920245 RepID=UPI0019A76748|nr:surface-adhesin E family protein [Kangiella sp.]MBD3654452.1 sel1 repeat family protein [Kangiella sp.]